MSSWNWRNGTEMSCIVVFRGAMLRPAVTGVEE
jgi:hypothetical protein